MKAVRSVTGTPLPAENLVLAALPDADYQRLRPHLEFVALPVGRVLSEPGEPMTHVFFPISGIVALLTPLENGASTGVALTGNEGLTGESVFLEGMRARGPLRRAVVLSPGYAYRVRAPYALREFERGAAFRHLLLRATQALIAQIAQSVACNSRHKLPERLCSWMLHGLDRVPDDEICMTQSLLSDLLGVRREGLTEAAGHLQAAGVIKYARLFPASAGPDLRQAPRYGGVEGLREPDGRLHVRI